MMRKFGRRWSRVAIISVLTGVLLTGTGSLGLPSGGVNNVSKLIPYGTVEAATIPEVKKVGEEPITSGATLQNYIWTSTRDGETVQTEAHVIVVDLWNPYVKLDVMTGIDGKFTTKQSVLGMAKETGAIAGINGDFFSTKAEGVPMGPEIRSGELTTTPSALIGMYAFGITEDNEPIIDTYTFNGSVEAADGSTFPLAGINQTYYFKEPDGQHSHAHAMYIYTSDWGSIDRANDSYTIPTEVLVKNGVVESISSGKSLPQTPPEDGYILRAHGEAAQFVETHVQIGDRIDVDYELVPGHSQVDPSSFKMLIGGHTILVDEGKPTAYSRNVSSLGGTRSRTGIGYSQDKRRAYLITVDNTAYIGGDSTGMTLSEFSDFMARIGVWKGMLLDGGGSTQLVSRPLGYTEVELTNETEYGNPRPVVNGIGIYSLAPEGTLKGMIISGESTLFINQRAQYYLKAYDQYYNPIEIDDRQVSWRVSPDLGVMEGNVWIPTQSGKGTIVAQSGDVTKEFDVEVVGFEQIDEMMIDLSEGYMLAPGITVDVPVQVITKDGNKRTVPAESIAWDFIGFDAKIEGDRLSVQQVENNQQYGQIIANYDGFRTMFALPTGVTRKWTDFETEALPISFAGYPSYVKGKARQVVGLPGDDPDNDVLLIEYDFSEGSDTKAAYAVLNGSEGMALEGEPKQMSLRVKGDNSLNWVRVEFEDSSGKKHLVDVTQNMNWTGWKTIHVDLNPYQMNYPIKIKKIYVANPAQYQDEREVYGAVAIDDISFQYERELQEQQRPIIQLTVNDSVMFVNGEQYQMDQAPVVIDGTTLVPLRFVVDALGGAISWEDKEKKVGVMKDDQLADLWIGKTEVIIGGKRVEARVAPMIMNQRTMIPLRLISEQFGWNVIWNQQNKTITLQ